MSTDVRALDHPVGSRGTTVWPTFAAQMRRRHWAHLLMKWAPDRCTIATAAAIIGKDARDLGREVAADFDEAPLPSALVGRDELVTALRRPPHRRVMAGQG